MGCCFWVWYLWGWSTVDCDSALCCGEPIVIHNRGSLFQVPWRKDAEGQIGFLTEWGISCWGDELGKSWTTISLWAAVGVPFICPRTSRVIEIQGRVHSGQVEGVHAPPAAEQHDCSLGSHYKYLIPLLLLWMTRMSLKELILSLLSIPHQNCRVLLTQLGLTQF